MKAQPNNEYIRNQFKLLQKETKMLIKNNNKKASLNTIKDATRQEVHQENYGK